MLRLAAIGAAKARTTAVAVDLETSEATAIGGTFAHIQQRGQRLTDIKHVVGFGQDVAKAVVAKVGHDRILAVSARNHGLGFGIDGKKFAHGLAAAHAAGHG